MWVCTHVPVSHSSIGDPHLVAIDHPLQGVVCAGGRTCRGQCVQGAVCAGGSVQGVECAGGSVCAGGGVCRG